MPCGKRLRAADRWEEAEQHRRPDLPGRSEKKEPPKKKKNSREQKRLYRERTQALYKGRQHDAIKEFCDRTGWSYTQIAKALGVSQTTVAYWAKEYSPANWKLLAKLGIEEVRV